MVEERVRVRFPTSVRAAEQVLPRRQPLKEMIEEGVPLDGLLKLLKRPVEWSQRSIRLGTEIGMLEGAEGDLVAKAQEIDQAFDEAEVKASTAALKEYLGLARGSIYAPALAKLTEVRAEETKRRLALDALRARMDTLPRALRTSMSQDLAGVLKEARDKAQAFKSEFLASFPDLAGLGIVTPSQAARQWSDLQMGISQVASWRNRVTGLPERPPGQPLLITPSDLEDFARQGRSEEDRELLQVWGRELTGGGKG